MKIACLGWGSLVWDPQLLPIRRYWYDDGPLVPVEFSRKSKDGRITLVITDGAAPVRVLWALMTETNVKTAQQALIDRERCTCDTGVGTWGVGCADPDAIQGLGKWAEVHSMDAVIWTALGTTFKSSTESSICDQVIKHLRNLTGPQRDTAKTYIENAPVQIDTEYRRRIQAELGWETRTFNR